MAASKPVFVFVPGAFQGSPHFEPIVKALGARGYDAMALDLPGIGEDAGTAPPLESVKFIRSKIQALVNAGKEVVLVGCSYGGFVSSMSVKDFEVSARAGQRGGVKRIVFVAALLIPEDTNMLTALGGGLPPWAELDPEKGILNPAAACAGLFFSEMDESAQKHYATLFKAQSPRDSMATVKDSCWNIDVPKTYIHTTKDATSPLEMQKMMVEGVVNVRSQDWSFETMDSDHSPFLSQTEQLTDILEKLSA